MSTIFCCSAIQSYKSRTLSHESKFAAFISWAKLPMESSIVPDEAAPNATETSLAIQVVKRVNYGPLESKRYFVQHNGDFSEVNEKWLVDANFEKLNTYKNYKCSMHNKFFEINVYQKNAINAHHWRANIARPAGEIDL